MGYHSRKESWVLGACWWIREEVNDICLMAINDEDKVYVWLTFYQISWV